MKNIQVNWTINGGDISFTSFGMQMMMWQRAHGYEFEGTLDVSRPGTAYVDGVFTVPDDLHPVNLTSKFINMAVHHRWECIFEKTEIEQPRQVMLHTLVEVLKPFGYHDIHDVGETICIRAESAKDLVEDGYVRELTRDELLARALADTDYAEDELPVTDRGVGD